MTPNLFEIEENQQVRTIGFYQPFGSLMLHGKIETRWVMTGKKPPFPKGKYVFYTTQKPCAQHTLFDWCGHEIMYNINNTLENDNTRGLNKCIIGYGDLVDVRKLMPEDEPKAFVKYIGTKDFETDKGIVNKTQWALVFENVTAITPMLFIENGKSLGKQGIGFLPESFKHIINQ